MPHPFKSPKQIKMQNLYGSKIVLDQGIKQTFVDVDEVTLNIEIKFHGVFFDFAVNYNLLQTV